MTMPNPHAALFDLNRIESFADRDSPIHRIDPRAKLIVTMLFIVSVVSYGKYEVSALLPFVLYPVVTTALSGVPAGPILTRLVWAAPFAFFMGIFNPVFDRTTVTHIGTLAISGGWVSFVSILIRFSLTVSAALLLIATTGFMTVCDALGRMGLPRAFVTQLMVLFRYLFVLAEEAGRMTRARNLRTFQKRGQGIRVFSFMIGHLLLRTIDRATRIHLAMCCRGFNGMFARVQDLRFRSVDAAFIAGWSALFLLFRSVDIPRWIGRFVETAGR
ncbi:MAG: cobalt ECF transporter T component CbiQ [Thermodesulfobacteriota bacterium]